MTSGIQSQTNPKELPIDKAKKMAMMRLLLRSPHAPVAQLDRASDYESEGRRFESFQAHIINQILTDKNSYFNANQAA